MYEASRIGDVSFLESELDHSEWIEDVLADVSSEIVRAAKKHGWKDVPTNPEISAEKAFIILAEEFGEVARALTHDEGSLDNLEDELIQTAAMAVAMLVGVRRRMNWTRDADVIF